MRSAHPALRFCSSVFKQLRLLRRLFACGVAKRRRRGERRQQAEAWFTAGKHLRESSANARASATPREQRALTPGAYQAMLDLRALAAPRLGVLLRELSGTLASCCSPEGAASPNDHGCASQARP